MFFIKPEISKEYGGEILCRICAAGLSIVVMQWIKITQRHLDSLYGHLHPEIQFLLQKQLLGRVCPVALVRGKNALEILLKVTGEHTEPARCALGTIRYNFGDHRPGYQRFNAVHRPKTAEEAKAHITLFGLDDFPG